MAAKKHVEGRQAALPPAPPLRDAERFYARASASGGNFPVPKWEPCGEDGSGPETPHIDEETGTIYVPAFATSPILRHQLGHFILWLARHGQLKPGPMTEAAIKVLCGRLFVAEDCGTCQNPESSLA